MRLRAASRKSSSPKLFTATGISGMPVLDDDGTPLGKAVEALVECRSGEVRYVVVATTSSACIAKQLRPVSRRDIVFTSDELGLQITRGAFDDIAPIDPDSWPLSS